MILGVQEIHLTISNGKILLYQYYPHNNMQHPLHHNIIFLHHDNHMPKYTLMLSILTTITNQIV